MNQIQKAIHAALLNLIEYGPVSNFGICCEVDEFRNSRSTPSDVSEHDVDEEMRKLFKTWKHFSGDDNYPVPYWQGCRVGLFNNSVDSWDQNTEYGRLRWDLVDHMLQELEK